MKGKLEPQKEKQAAAEKERGGSRLKSEIQAKLRQETVGRELWHCYL